MTDEPASASSQQGILSTGTLVLWCLAMVWLLPLISCEILRPRLRYDVRRWATVFPLGMYATCSFITGEVVGLAAITGFGHAWTWVAFSRQTPDLPGAPLRQRDSPQWPSGRRAPRWRPRS